MALLAYEGIFRFSDVMSQSIPMCNHYRLTQYKNMYLNISHKNFTVNQLFLREKIILKWLYSFWILFEII